MLPCPVHIVTIFNFHSSHLKTWKIAKNGVSFWCNSLYPNPSLSRGFTKYDLPLKCISLVCAVSHSKVFLISRPHETRYNFLNNFKILILFLICCSERSFFSIFKNDSSSFIKSNINQYIKQKLRGKEKRPNPLFSQTLCQMDSTDPGVLKDHWIIVQSRQ